jgi:hypothetical protein
MPRIPVLVRRVWAVRHLILEQARHVPGLLQQPLQFHDAALIFPSTLACPANRLSDEPGSLAHFRLADFLG